MGTHDKLSTHCGVCCSVLDWCVGVGAGVAAGTGGGGMMYERISSGVNSSVGAASNDGG